jgi:hypothetical protein
MVHRFNEHSSCEAELEYIGSIWTFLSKICIAVHIHTSNVISMLTVGGNELSAHLQRLHTRNGYGHAI